MEKSIKKAVYGSPDRPLKIGGIEIPAYVLEDGTRVLTQRNMISALGMTIGGGSRRGEGGRAQVGNKLAQFVATKALEPYISKEILERAQEPIKFKLPNGTAAHGYEATLLPDICNAVLESREKGTLDRRQTHIAKQCEILVRGLATVGIIALVDEATGYQEVRDKQALKAILDKYLTDEWAKWTKTFPDEFYKQLFRLKNMPYPPATRNKPSYIGHWTNNIVYSRLAPGILAELKKKNPRTESGSRARHHHQHMTPDYGSPELKSYLDRLTFLMRGCATWTDFERKLNRAAPKYGATLAMDFLIPNEGDE